MWKRGAMVITTRYYAKSVTKQEIQQIITSDSDDYVLIDVREPDEFNAGAIPTGRNLPC